MAKGRVCIRYLVRRVDEIRAEINDYQHAMRDIRIDLDADDDNDDKLLENKAYKALKKCLEISERELSRVEDQEVTISNEYPDFFAAIDGVKFEKG